MGALVRYTKELFELSSQYGFWLRPLGQVHDHTIWLVRTRATEPFSHKQPRVLITAGFHGEEVAGPWGILEWLKGDIKKWLDKIDISFIPIVNPDAFVRGTRYNRDGQKSNCGFYHFDKMGETRSAEGQILYRNVDLLRPLSHNGFLSLHEDVGVKECYIYTFEHGGKPGPFSWKLREELGSQFNNKFLDDYWANSDADAEGNKHLIQNGMVYKLCDGSFEDMMFHLGVPKTAVTETPGKFRLSKRVKAVSHVINSFLELISKPENET